MKILTVTGCKPMELNIFNETDERIRYLKKALEKRLIGFIEAGVEWVLISGQMGVELWTADIVLELQNTYPVKLAIIPPFENQTSRWPEHLQLKYDSLTYEADFFKPIYNGDYKGPYQFRARDEWLIKKSDACLILADEEYPGSTGYFLKATQSVDDYPIYFITPDDLDDVVEEMRMTDPDYWTDGD